VCLSHEQRGGVSPAAPALTEETTFVARHSHIERLVSFWDSQREGWGGGGIGGRGRLRGLPQRLGARVHGGGAWAPSLRRGLPVRAASRALRRRGGGR
jgi:hypothetical protein